MPAHAELTTFKGLPAVHLLAPNGAHATVLLHGAHVVSWRPAGGDEQLFLSDRAVFADGQAVRGGIPVCFPQFADRGPLPKHGFARTRAWHLVQADTAQDDALAVLRLMDDERTRALWPHGFELEATVRVGHNRLDVELSLTNTGALGFGFTAALHTYLMVHDLEHMRIEGLEGLSYTNTASGGNLETEGHAQVFVAKEVDRIYHRATRTVTLREPGRQVAAGTEGFTDVVIWNPGSVKSAALNDMAPRDYRRMVCVEAGLIERPHHLGPGEGWVGRQTLTASS